MFLKDLCSKQLQSHFKSNNTKDLLAQNQNSWLKKVIRVAQNYFVKRKQYFLKYSTANKRQLFTTISKSTFDINITFKKQTRESI